MTHPHWPLLDLRITVGDLELRPLVEADLAEVVRRLPTDLELDPHATRFDVPEGVLRAVVVHQEYWRSYGTWTVDAWRFHLAVRRDGELLGLQELEGNDFPTLRTVDTSSWLMPEVRGTGVGKEMRRAVLSLAFDRLGALAAITSAWHDNHASLGVSRSLGYRPNGESLMAREGLDNGVDTLVHLRMTAADWAATGGSQGVTVVGVDACRPWFGV
jgi:RimJ/RimL family protein N-acetyltransferase